MFRFGPFTKCPGIICFIEPEPLLGRDEADLLRADEAGLPFFSLVFGNVSVSRLPALFSITLSG